MKFNVAIRRWLSATTALSMIWGQLSSSYAMMESPEEQRRVGEEKLRAARSNRPTVISNNNNIQGKEFKDNQKNSSTFVMPAILKETEEALHKNIIQSLQAQTDTFTGLIANLRSAVTQLSDDKRQQIRKKLPNLLNASLSLDPWALLRDESLLRGQASLMPEHKSFNRLRAVMGHLKSLADSLEFPSPSISQMYLLREHYQGYMDNLSNLPSYEREIWLSPVRLYIDGNPYLISRTTAYSLLSMGERGIPEKHNSTGSSIVTHMGNIYAKQTLVKGRTQTDELEGTLDPAMEEAMGNLYRLLFQEEGLVSSSLIVLSKVPVKGKISQEKQNEEEQLTSQAHNSNMSVTDRKAISNRLEEDESFKTFKSYPLQITAEVKGEFLGDFLKRALAEPSLFQQLDQVQLQRMILFHLLTHPADAKGDNLIVTFGDDEGNNRQIISIDNDLSLASMVIQERPDFHTLEAQSILWAIPQFMQQPICMDVQDQFLSLQPTAVMLTWFACLRQANGQYEQLRAQGLLDESTFRLLKLPLSFKRGVAAGVLQRFSFLQEYLRQDRQRQQETTLQSLFDALHPLAAVYIKEVIAKEADPLKGFNKLYKRQYALEQILQGQTVKTVSLQPFKQQEISILDFIKTENTAINAYKQREQSVEDTAIEVLQATPWQGLKGKDQIDALERALLTFPQALRATMDQLPFLHALMSYQPSLSLVQFFTKAMPQTLTDRDQDGKTVLHNAIDAQTSNIVIEHLLQQGVDVNASSKRRESPLDLAAFSNQPQVFVQLVQNGAQQIQLDIALKFYGKQLPFSPQSSVSSSFMQLVEKDKALHWHFLLHHLLPEQGEGPKVKTISFGERILPFQGLSSTFDSKGTIKAINKTGRHAVGIMEKKIHNQSFALFLKEYPELPGLEEAAGSLIRQLFGFGAPYSELMRYNNKPYMLSQGIVGPTMADAFKKDSSFMQYLDAEDTSALIVGSMLINPEDGKPDNYIVEDISSSSSRRYRLIAIDNDHAFVPGVAKEQKAGFFSPTVQVQVKTILFCLDYMLGSVPSAVRQKLLKLDVNEVLESWLRELRAKNDLYEQLFSDKERDELLSKHESFIGVPFHAGALKSLYNKMIRLQRTLHDHPQLSHLELLCRLEPALGHRYKKGFEGKLSPQERFKLLDEPFYRKDKQGNHQTITSSGAILQSMDVPLKQAMLPQEESINFKPHKALEELKALKRESLEDLLKKIQGGISLSPQLVKSIKNDTHVERLLKEVNFKALGETDQKALFELLKGRSLQHLRLKHASALTDQFLSENKNMFASLLTLNLSRALGITDSWLSMLAEGAPALTSLNLSFIPGIRNIVKKEGAIFVEEISVKFAALISLNVKECINLTKLNIAAPLLDWLNVKGCVKLTDSGLDLLIENSPRLKTLLLQDCSLVKDQDLRTAFPTYPISLALTPELRKTARKILMSVGKIKLKKEDLKLTAKMLKKALNLNNKLTTLDLGSNSIGEAGALAIAESLKGNTTLTSLNLYNNEIGEAGARAIAESLKGNTTLTTLDLGNNSIGEPGARAIAENLKGNTTLSTLDLGWNSIGETGVQAVAESLKGNATLSTLKLAGNKIGGAGACAVAVSLKGKSTLTSLDLGYNSIADAAQRTIREILKNNPNLKIDF